MKSKNFSDTPRIQRDDSLEIENIDHPFKFANSRNEELNSLIVESINSMGATGEDADKKYQRNLHKLKEYDQEAVKVIGGEYFRVPEYQYLDRWSLVQILVDLKIMESLKYFNEILRTDIPEEKSEDLHSFTTVGEEVMIRTTAIEGVQVIGETFREKQQDALRILLENVDHEQFSIKRASIQAYLKLGGRNARRELLEKIPEKDHFILDIKKTPVEKVPQATGGLFLKNDDEDSLPKL